MVRSNTNPVKNALRICIGLRSRSFIDQISRTILMTNDRKIYRHKTLNSVENRPLNNFFINEGKYKNEGL